MVTINYPETYVLKRTKRGCETARNIKFSFDKLERYVVQFFEIESKINLALKFRFPGQK